MPSGILDQVTGAQVVVTGDHSYIQGAVMTGGTKATPRNRNRNRPDASRAQVYTGATLTTAGSATLLKFSVGTGGTSTRSGGNSDGSGDEFVLKPDTTYSITFETTGASTASVATWGLFWYEEKKGQ
jgi:hypothetical protein